MCRSQPAVGGQRTHGTASESRRPRSQTGSADSVYFISHGLANPDGHGFSIGPTLVQPKSTGHIALRTADPSDPPVIQPNYLTAEEDWTTLLAGFKLGREIAAAPAFDAYRGDEFLPGSQVTSDDEIREFIRNHIETLYHPVGTCKMGDDPLAVVDAQLRVRGIQGLRVADASIMPTIINANTNAPSMMIGAKAARMIRQ